MNITALTHLENNLMTIVNRASVYTFYDIIDEIKNKTTVAITGGLTRFKKNKDVEDWGSYKDAIEIILRKTSEKDFFPFVLVVAHTNSTIEEPLLKDLIDIWTYCRSPCRLLIFTQSDSKNFIDMSPDQVCDCMYEPHNPFSIEETLLNKLKYLRVIYPKDEDIIMVIGPSSNFFKIDMEGVIQVNELEAPYTNCKVMVDTCMRTITYSSIGGGFRQVEDFVVGKDLEPMIHVSTANQVPIYFLMSKSKAGNKAGSYKPYKNIIRNPSSYEYIKKIRSFKINPILIDKNYESIKNYSDVIIQHQNVGILANKYLQYIEQFGKPTLTEIVLLSAIDTLNSSVFREVPWAPSSDDKNKEKKSEDTLSLFSNMWNDYASFKGTMTTWWSKYDWNHTMMAEWWSTMKSLAKDYHVSVRKRQIKDKEIQDMRKRFKKLIYMYEQSREGMNTLYFKNREIVGEEVFFFNDHYTSEKHMRSIGPLVVKDGSIQSFILWI